MRDISASDVRAARGGRGRERTGAGFEGGGDDGFVLGRVEGAGRVDEATSGLEEGDRAKEDAELETAEQHR